VWLPGELYPYEGLCPWTRRNPQTPVIPWVRRRLLAGGNIQTPADAERSQGRGLHDAETYIAVTGQLRKRGMQLARESDVINY